MNKKTIALALAASLLLAGCLSLPFSGPAYAGKWEGTLLSSLDDTSGPKATFILGEKTFEMISTAENIKVKGALIAEGVKMTLTAQFQSEKGEEYKPFTESSATISGTWSVTGDTITLDFGSSQKFKGKRAQ